MGGLLHVRCDAGHHEPVAVHMRMAWAQRRMAKKSLRAGDK